jgi:nucleotide sugar dehydrogenase
MTQSECEYRDYIKCQTYMSVKVMQNKTPKILIIGLGQIGYANAEYISEIGFHADGYDINKDAVKRAIADGVIRKEAKTFENYDYYMICVSTHDPQTVTLPSFDGLIRTIKRINREAKKTVLITIESTISETVCDEILNAVDHKLHVAHMTHRYYVKEKGKHGVRQLRVLGGCKQCCVNEAKNFYGRILDIPFCVVSSLKLAALCKVVENTYRFLEIAFAEELKILCDSHALDFEELRNAVNTKWNINILEPRAGIGGHCLPKDTQMYLDMAKNISSSIMESAVYINAEFEANLLDKRDFGIIPYKEKLINARQSLF